MNLEQEKRYWRIRQSLWYFQRVYQFINSLNGCSNVLDVGGGPAGLLFKIDPKKYVTKVLIDSDPGDLLGSDYNLLTNVIRDDFLRVSLPQFDVVACLQVLEHVDESKRPEFAIKLLQIARKYLVVTVPYKWEDEGNISKEDIKRWFSCACEFDIIRQPNEGVRLLCIFRREHE